MNVSELNMTSMNDFELKGILLSLVEKAKSRHQLLRFIEVLNETVEEDEDTFWSHYTPEQRATLEKSFKESYDSSNWVTHEEVMKKYEKWLK